jgi:cation diffusion facilitator CzcD-associated flavoprotein CzcO
LYRHAPVVQRLVRGALYGTRELLVVGLAKRRRFLRPVQALARGHLRRQVHDPELRAALTPGYTIGCKRILISNDFYPAISAPNAELVTAPIAEVRPTSVVTGDGVERPTDVLVLATGFSVTDLPIASRITGRDGRTLAQAWAEGMVSNRSTTVAGFPNLFLLVGPNVGVGHTSMIYMIESQVAYVDRALQAMAAEGLDVLETTPQAQEGYRRLIAGKSQGTVWLAGGCASWYLDRQGHNTTLWPDFSFRFRRMLSEFDRHNYVGLPAVAGQPPEPAVSRPVPPGAGRRPPRPGAADG